MTKFNNAWHRQWKAMRRAALVYYYSNGSMKCKDCGEDRYECLTFEHPNENGAAFRKSRNSNHPELIMKYLPDDIEILCYNCNCSKYYHSC